MRGWGLGFRSRSFLFSVMVRFFKRDVQALFAHLLSGRRVILRTNCALKGVKIQLPYLVSS